MAQQSTAGKRRRRVSSGPPPTFSQRLQTTWRAMRRNKAAYLFIAPSLFFFLIFSVYPVLDTIVFSFQSFVRGARVWVGFENYIDMFQDEIFLKSLENTAVYFLGMVPLGVILALTLSGLIYFLPSRRLQSLFKAAFYLPVATVSSVILALVWSFIYEPTFGLLNYLLSVVGIEPQFWLNNASLAKPSLMFMMHTQWWGGMIILLTASMDSVPLDLYEAARIDGASTLRQFFSVTIPLIRPAIAYVAIIATISSLRIFNEILIMTKGGPAWSTSNVAYDIYLTGINAFKFGPASAYAIVILVATVVLAILQYRAVNIEVEYA
ncbi:MAG: sugar ABC transporter permease [Anaerolineae bacterium]|nr:sugar ABC transporter permease [Anaerolineae bacterium]